MQIRHASPGSLRQHPLAHLVPDMRPSEWQDFYNDVAARGIKVPLEILADGTVVDGRHRLKAALALGMKMVPVLDAPLNGDQPDIYMLKAAVLRRHLSDDQRKMIAAMWKEENKQPAGRPTRDGQNNSAGRPAELNQHIGHTRAAATEQFNVSRWGVDQATYVLHRNPGLAEKVHKGEAALNRAYRQVKRDEEGQKVIAPDSEAPITNCQCICGDLADTYPTLPALSIDLIITDPPYAEKSLDVYSVLAKAALHLLKEGGSLLVMVGESYLPEIINHISGRLRYHWILAYLTPGGQAPQMWQRKVNTFWKPVLWFTKGKYDGGWVGDVIRSAVNDNDKQFSPHGQSESGMADLMKRFTKPGMTVLDPFLGGGTTGVIALQLGCNFIGIEKSQDTLNIAKVRINGTTVTN